MGDIIAVMSRPWKIEFRGAPLVIPRDRVDTASYCQERHALDNSLILEALHVNGWRTRMVVKSLVSNFLGLKTVD